MSFLTGRQPAVREWIEETFGIETHNLARLTIVITPHDVVTVTAEIFATDKMLGDIPAELASAEVQKEAAK
jgi:hypothetical protein